MYDPRKTRKPEDTYLDRLDHRTACDMKLPLGLHQMGLRCIRGAHHGLEKLSFWTNLRIDFVKEERIRTAFDESKIDLSII
jgi:hypothetical protein